MVYLLHSYFGRDGRDEAEELLERQSGNRDKPRILQAFNEPIDNWLDFYMFTMFTDRDGKDRKSTRLNSSHTVISYAVFCLKKKKYSQHADATPESAEARTSTAA